MPRPASLRIRPRRLFPDGVRAGFLLLSLTLAIGAAGAAGLDVAPAPGHPGNVFLEGETVRVPWPPGVPPGPVTWRLLDDRLRPVAEGRGTVPGNPGGAGNDARAVDPGPDLGRLGVGWYRLEATRTEPPASGWTSLAVLPPLKVRPPADTPVAVDSAPAWFARGDASRQADLARLAALAGVGSVRDRLRWGDLQPGDGPLRPAPTTYDTSADALHAEGLQVLQVFHDTPAWAREASGAGGRFAPDLRRVHALGRALAQRFHGRVGAWEPWNEANVATFGGHTVDAMCSWQKAAWLGFKSGDPEVVVGWNPTAAVPTPAHTEGVLANETWPYFDTYNLHSYDWPHAYPALWQPAREAASGRPIWVTEADRGTPHRNDPPWFDQEPRLERLKAEWMAQSYALSLFAGSRRHYHFILGNYQEPQGVQFGLLRHDLTPRPAYVALAAVGRWLAGARCLGRWRPGAEVQVYAFEARPDGEPAEVLVAWVEKEADWDARGTATAPWPLPERLPVRALVDDLGRSLPGKRRPLLTSAPTFVVLPPGGSRTLPLEPPPAPAAWRPGTASPVVLQIVLPRSSVVKVEDLPWSEGYAYRASPGEPLTVGLNVYHFASTPVSGRFGVERLPAGWTLEWDAREFRLEPGAKGEFTGRLLLPPGSGAADGWVGVRAECGALGRPVVAFRVRGAP